VYLPVFGTLLVRSVDRLQANGGVRFHPHDHPVQPCLTSHNPRYGQAWSSEVVSKA
jgi:hypothetical protein